MTRNATQSSPEPKKPAPKRGETEFDRPDTERSAEGAPAHGSSGSPAHDDARHGYSQDSGYQGSGGTANEQPAHKRTRTEVSEETRTSYDEDAKRAPRK